MQSQRPASTNRLSDIIHIIHMGEKSGVLTVERGEGETLEEGLITFVNGQVIEAKARQQSGPTAFKYLNAWQSCRFSFSSQAMNGAIPPPRMVQPSTPLYSDSAGNVYAANPRLFEKMPRTTGRLPENSNGWQSPLPWRLPAGEELSHHPESNGRLPRTHWRLLLLVNGQRSIDELARLMSRDVHELQTLLDDLERSGLIRQ